MKTALKVVGAAVLVGFVFAVIASTAQRDGAARELPDIDASELTEPSHGEAAGSGVDLPVASAEHVPDGMWLVGSDIPAGTYRTAGAADSMIPNCYWERLSDASGEFSSIIANGNETGPASVSLTAGEYFKISGCRPWAIA